VSWTHLSASKFFLWGRAKYETQPAGTPDIKQAIRYYSEAIPQDLMQCVIASLPGQMQECRASDGSHLKKCHFQMLSLAVTLTLNQKVCTYLFIN
jgi:hypothetical protein